MFPSQGKGGARHHPQKPGGAERGGGGGEGELRGAGPASTRGCRPRVPTGGCGHPDPVYAAHVCACESLCARPGSWGSFWWGGGCLCVHLCVRSRMHELIISNSNDFQRGSESIAQSGDPGGLPLALRTQLRLSGLCSPPRDSAGALRGSRRRGAAEGPLRSRPPSPPVRGTNPSPPSSTPGGW